MQAVVLAAGRGSRLQPLTAVRSKAMVPVLGRPLVDRAVEPLMRRGVVELIFVVSPEDEEIAAYLDGLRAGGVAVQRLVQEPRLGTGHAVALAAPAIRGPFAVWACDSIVDAAHAAALMAAAESADAVLSVLEVDPQRASASAVVELEDNRVRRIVEKPDPGVLRSETISLPHYVFGPRLLPELAGLPLSPRGEHEIQDAIQRLIDRGGRVVAVRAPRRFQVSTPGDLLQLGLRLLAADGGTAVSPGAVIGDGVRLTGPLRIEADAVVASGARIGPLVSLETGSTVGRGATLRHAVVLPGGQVRDGEVVTDTVVC